MNKKLYLTLIFFSVFIFLIINISAYKQNSCIQLYQFCDDCTYTNLTNIGYPDGTYSNLNEAMTKINQNYNYTFCNTSQLGSYSYNTCGDKYGLYYCEQLYFEITPSNIEYTLPIVIVLVCLLILIIYLLIQSYKIIKLKNNDYDYKKLTNIKSENILSYYSEILKNNIFIIGYFLVYIFILLFVTVLNILLFNIGLTELSEFTKNIIPILGWGLIPFSLFWVAWIIYKFYDIAQNILSNELGGFIRK